MIPTCWYLKTLANPTQEPNARTQREFQRKQVEYGLVGHRSPGYPLKLHFQIPCVFPVPIYVICDYYILKTDWADFARFRFLFLFLRQILKYLLPLESGNLQLEQTKFPVFWQNFQIPYVFFGHFPYFSCFPCAVGTLIHDGPVFMLFEYLLTTTTSVGQEILFFNICGPHFGPC